MSHPFETKLALAWPPQRWKDLTVLLAVSGGADSVALLRAMHAQKAEGTGQLAVAHFHHGLRGLEADADQELVEAICSEAGVTCHVGHGEVGELAQSEGDGLEAAARTARYRFLQQTAQRLGARYVVTAHTADDQMETILHRIVRGTGIAGLRGMPRARELGPAVALIRPLLALRRSEVLAYLGAIGQPCRFDTSNLDTRLTRNRIRRELLPQLAAEYNPGVGEALLRLGQLAGEAQEVIDHLTDRLVGEHITATSTQAVEIDCRRLADVHNYLLRELLIRTWREQGWPEQAMGYAKWGELAEMARIAAPARAPVVQMFPGRIVARREGDTLRLERQSE